LPAGGSGRWWAFRLSMVRGFAGYRQTLDPATDVSPKDLLAGRPPRATPYLYADEEIAALLAAADTLRFPLWVATYRTLVGLLAADPRPPTHLRDPHPARRLPRRRQRAAAAVAFGDLPRPRPPRLDLLTGTCRPRPSCSRSPDSGSSVTSGHGRERARPDPAG